MSYLIPYLCTILFSAKTIQFDENISQYPTLTKLTGVDYAAMQSSLLPLKTALLYDIIFFIFWVERFGDHPLSLFGIEELTPFNLPHLLKLQHFYW